MESNAEGIELGLKLQNEYKIPFIYISAFSSQGIIKEALQTKPAAYITKPFKESDVFAALNLLVINFPDLCKYIINFKFNKEQIRLKSSDILYIEGSGNYVTLVGKSRKYLLRNSIDYFLNLLPEKEFMRVHKSYVVNLHEIEKQSSDVLVIQGVKIPISRQVKSELNIRMNEL